MLFKRKLETPPIFADLVIELNGQWARIDVETPGWAAQARNAIASADRVGLVMRGEKEPRIWLTVNGSAPRYFSRVIGKINDASQRQVRVACLQTDSGHIWLHRDGVVEVQPEPSFRECK